MAEIILLVSNVGLLALLFWERRNALLEKKELVDAIVSQRGYAEDLAHLKAVRQNTENFNKSVVVPQPNTPVEELSDEEFDKFIDTQVSQ